MIAPFHVLSNSSGAGHGELAIALGAEFGTVALGPLEAALGTVAADLAALVPAPPAEQLSRAGTVLARHLASEPRPHDRFGFAPTFADLLPHEAVQRRRGHELTVTLLALEAARRAGLRLGLIGSPAGVFVGHPRLNAPMLLAPALDWHPLSACDLDEPQLAWRCPHEAVAQLLDLIQDRARETGHLAHELRAAELYLHLPVDAARRRRFEQRLAAVRARLN